MSHAKGEPASPNSSSPTPDKSTRRDNARRNPPYVPINEDFIAFLEEIDALPSNMARARDMLKRQKDGERPYGLRRLKSAWRQDRSIR